MRKVNGVAVSATNTKPQSSTPARKPAASSKPAAPAPSGKTPSKPSTSSKPAAPAKPAKLTAAEQTIKDYLDAFAKKDSVFAKKYAKSGKTIKGCMAYVTSQAKKQAQSGSACIADDEVFGWAVHYYDEDDIKEQATIAKAPAARTTVSNSPDPDEDETYDEDEQTEEEPQPKRKPTTSRKPSTSSRKPSAPASDPFDFDLF